MSAHTKRRRRSAFRRNAVRTAEWYWFLGQMLASPIERIRAVARRALRGPMRRLWFSAEGHARPAVMRFTYVGSIR